MDDRILKWLYNIQQSIEEINGFFKNSGFLRIKEKQDVEKGS